MTDAPPAGAPRSASDGVRVEPAGPEAQEAVHAVARASFDAAWSAEALGRELARRDARAWVARAGTGGPVLGYLLARRVHDELEVLSVAVAPASRRRGVAAALLERSLAWEAARGAARALLEVRVGDRAAQRCYARVGFAVVGRRPRYYPGGEDALLMTCEPLPGARGAAAAVASPAPGLPVRLDAPVADNRRDGGGNLRLRLEVGETWPPAAPGQFVMLSPGALPEAPRHDPLLPRPMAVFRRDGPHLEVLYKVVGRGTALLSAARRGDRVRVVGPLGRGFPVPAAGEHALLVGGGTGVASLFDLAARGAAGGAQVSVLLGARSRSDLMAEGDFHALPVAVSLATEDGSAGHRGLVTELLEAALAGAPAQAALRVYACGPTGMMRRAAELAREAGRPALVSLENRMACGYGICLGCAVPRREAGFALVCRDGPVLPADELSWDGLP